MSRWAITSVTTITKDDGTSVTLSPSYFKHFDGAEIRGERYGFNFFGKADEAKTWRTKADAVNYLRRQFGARPGQNGYDVVRVHDE